MPKRKVLIAVSVARGIVSTKNSRGGETHRPEERIDLLPGQVFDFTAEEIEDIEAAHDKPFDDKVEVEISDEVVTSAEIKAKKPGKKPGKTEDL